MVYAIIKSGICENIIEAGPDFAAGIGAVELPGGYGIGDYYDGENWTKAEPPEEPPTSPAKLREDAYMTMTENEDGDILIPWEGGAVTVNRANDLWLYYAAEDSSKADELRTFIQAAKAYIRELYPDAGQDEQEE
jgi:hypothetical protein